MTLVDRVAIYLHSQLEPASAADIARALEASTEGVQTAIGDLIKRKLVRRHHYTDAILRYDCLPEGIAHVEKLLHGKHRLAATDRCRQLTPNSRKVMEVLAGARGSLTRAGIFAALDGALTIQQLVNVLSHLRIKGHVISPGSGSRGIWSLARPEEWAVLMPAPGDPAEAASASPLGAPRESAIERLAQDAQAATASLLEALAHAADRSPALVKVAAANSLLVQARSIVQQEKAA